MCKAEIVSGGRSSAPRLQYILDVYRWFAVGGYFNIYNSGIFSIVGRNSPFPLYLLYVIKEVGYSVATPGHQERWLYFYANKIVYQNQAETFMQYQHKLFPDRLRLQLDMLVILHLSYSFVCLAISRSNVVVSLYLVSPV